MTVSSEAKRRIIERTMQRVTKPQRRYKWQPLIAAATAAAIFWIAMGAEQPQLATKSPIEFVPFLQDQLAGPLYTTTLNDVQATFVGAYWQPQSGKLHLFSRTKLALETVKVNGQAMRWSEQRYAPYPYVLYEASYRGSKVVLTVGEHNVSLRPVKLVNTKQGFVVGHQQTKIAATKVYIEQVGEKTYVTTPMAKAAITGDGVAFDELRRAYYVTQPTTVTVRTTYKQNIDQQVTLPQVAKGESRAFSFAIRHTKVTKVERTTEGKWRLYPENDTGEPFMELGGESFIKADGYFETKGPVRATAHTLHIGHIRETVAWSVDLR